MNAKLLGVALLGLCCGLAWGADTVYLTNGAEINGTVVEENAATVVVKRENGALQSFRRADVEAIIRTPATPPAEPPAPAPAAKKSEASPKKLEGDKKEETAKPPAPAAKAETGEGKAKEGETKPAEGTAAAKVGETKTPEGATAPKKEGEGKTPEGATAPKEGEGKAAEAAAAPKEGETKTKEAAAAGTEPGKKAAEPSALAPDKKGEGKAKETAEAKEEKKEEWTPPPGLPGFPESAKRMSKDKEEKFMAALERSATTNEAPRVAAKAEIAALGPGVLPYLVGGCYHAHVEARASCMYLIGDMNGRNALKQAIELLYAVMPPGGEAATYQVPFVRAIKTTLSTISGQPFIGVEPSSSLVQEGLRRYIDWYNNNFDRLPPQLGEKEIEATDPDYMKKLKEARALKLEKRSWPRPPLSADIVQGDQNVTRPRPQAKDMETPAAKALRDSIPTVKRDSVGR